MAGKKRRFGWLWKGLKWLGLGLLAFALFALWSAWVPMGTTATGERLAKMQAAPNWSAEKEAFTNTLPAIEPDMWEAGVKFLTGGSEHRLPTQELDWVARDKSAFATPPKDWRVTWLGHSTVIIEQAGQTVLVDPVWGDRPAPLTWAGPKRFYPPPLPMTELPKLDAVVISHDHYDHLDYPTVVQLLGLQPDVTWIVPLGVGAHLAYWDVPEAKIIELKWWDETQLGGLRVVATPSRHFSGRTLARDHTLWAGWAFISDQHRLFYSGDTSMFPGFAEIGAKLGPFDLTMMEVGAYNQLWRDVHLGPEQALEAHKMLGGKVMMPVHWGLFDLALHGWTEPIERVMAAANLSGAKIAHPKPGQSLSPDTLDTFERWWPDVPWETAEQAPLVSSGLD